jgi:NitT/TauT family transport system permease protein
VLRKPAGRWLRALATARWLVPRRRGIAAAISPRALDWAWGALLALACVACAWLTIRVIATGLDLREVVRVFGLGFLPLLRVVVLIALASVVWVPIGIWVGLRPKAAQRVQPVAQFLAAFPANVLFPVAVIVLVATHADPNIWLSPLMILGTQCYLHFKVIAGASVFPNDLKEAAAVYRIRSWTWWRRVALPGIFPYYVTGALTASGGSWNASIVAEVVTWGDHKLEAFGLGSYIADATAAGDYSKVALGIAVMALFVTVLNRTLWRPLYVFAERRLRLA